MSLSINVKGECNDTTGFHNLHRFLPNRRICQEIFAYAGELTPIALRALEKAAEPIHQDSLVEFFEWMEHKEVLPKDSFVGIYFAHVAKKKNRTHALRPHGIEADLLYRLLKDTKCRDLLTVKILDLASGYFTSLRYSPLRELSPAIALFPSLTQLNLQGHHLDSLPSEICALSKLRLLNLSNNRLKALPQKFSELRQLRHLMLNGNKFSSPPTVVANLPRLRLLTVDIAFFPSQDDTLKTALQKKRCQIVCII
ncbi:MAG: leucine-rich repeat domain-containing protein [Chlamydiales bacterium]